MLEHNLSQDFNLNDIWNKRNQLSQEENTVLERLTWGHGWGKHQSEDAWYRREWDEFGFESVNPVSSVPQTANEISTSMNPGCRQ